MASMVAENWESVMDGHDNSEGFEFSQIDRDLLMSLLDETQVVDCDDERLTNVIRSLEAEIGSDGHHVLNNTMWDQSDLADRQSSNDGEPNGQDALLPQDDLDLEWMDLETMPSSPSGVMGNWYMDHHGQGMMGGMSHEFGGVRNFSNLCYGTPLEEQDYGSLWHEINVNMNS